MREEIERVEHETKRKERSGENEYMKDGEEVEGEETENKMNTKKAGETRNEAWRRLER